MYSPIKNSGRWSPYFVIAVAAILAYLPVSSMLFSLRNDVVAIEYPIQHFISEGLRNGEFPSWFNTWAMGFPLQSVLSWGVYSTPQMLIGLLFESNIYVLHAEFIFFIIASGCVMYKLLKTHFISDKKLSLLFACCYMLSGFTVGSSQWLLYITGMTFMPLVIYCLLSMLKTPSLKYSILFTISFFLLLTNVHIYLTVVSSYILTFFLLGYFVRLFFLKSKSQKEKLKVIKFIFLTFLFTLLLCAAPAYYSYEVITYLARSQPLAHESIFFQSNYLPPDGLSSLLLPLSSIRTSHINTEGIILDTYIGLLPLILLPLSIVINLKQKNNTAWNLLALSILFLFISFGHLTPVRGWLNILPGMSHFRHPGVLRIFFIFAFILYLASSFKNYNLSKLFQIGTTERKAIMISLSSLIILSTIPLLLYASSLFSIWKGSAYQTIKSAGKEELLAASSVIQLISIFILLFSVYRKHRLFSFIIISELIINTLVCTPFFSVSSYPVKEVNKILASPNGFPVQQHSPHDIISTITDSRNNSWFNINTYRKEVSNKESMSGPLIIDTISKFLSRVSIKNWLAEKKLIFINDTLLSLTDFVKTEEQRPGRVTAKISLSSPKEIILQQAYFPGWKAYYNNQPIALSKNNTPFVSAIYPAGEGTIIFKYEKPGVLYSALLLHIIVLITLANFIVRKIRFKSSSLS